MLRITEDLADIPATQWDELAGDDPFLSHAYLYALQRSGCATPEFGWHPKFLTLWQADRLVGAVPLYRKTHSYGEHVFDFAWADAYDRRGLRYYPKLVCTVPFTPVAGKRLLGQSGEVRRLLLEAALRLAKDSGVSSLHCLFLVQPDIVEAQAQGMLLRRDVQFHWQNPGYRDFEEFLKALSHDKRKRIRQERRRVREAGIELRCLTGDHASQQDWSFFASCYAHTRAQHLSPPALNEDFFQGIGAAMSKNTLLVIALRNGRPIASALNMATADVLYGRSWGALEFHPGLHFETCYYQAIEFCISRGIKTFEGGAQGEHKLARGFLPVTTCSAHWIANPSVSRLVEVHLRQESSGIAQYLNDLKGRAPFREA